jgi:cytochrome c551/c552
MDKLYELHEAVLCMPDVGPVYKECAQHFEEQRKKLAKEVIDEFDKK